MNVLVIIGTVCHGLASRVHAHELDVELQRLVNHVVLALYHERQGPAGMTHDTLANATVLSRRLI